MSVNRIILIGRLTKSPELRTTNSGKNVVEFSIAVQKRIKPNDGSADADFFRCKAWGQTADYVSQYLDKGRLVAVDGRLETRKWTDQNGGNRESVEIVADNVNGLDRPRDDDQEKATSHTRGTRSSTSAPSEEGEEYNPFADE